MSFMLTIEQIKNRKKFVTRRFGWKNLRPGQLIQAVNKGQGLKKGEHPIKLCVLKCVSNKPEPLNKLIRHLETGMMTVAIEGAYDADGAYRECVLEGFPDLLPEAFVKMFCEHNNCSPDTCVQRIEFEYV